MNRAPLSLPLLLCLTGAGALRAGSRSSADYQILTDITGSAGGSSSSANYSGNASTGGGVTGEAGSGTLTNLSGYIAQLENEATYLSWIHAALPAGLPAPAYQETSDYDHDGSSNYDEWLALTDPAASSSWFFPTITPSGASVVLAFPSATGRIYVLRQSENLAPGSWVNAPAQPVLTGSGGILTFTVPYAGVLRRFFQIQPLLP